MDLRAFSASRRFIKNGFYTQTLRIMRITAFLLLAVCLHASASSYSQTITLSVKNASLEKVFAELEHQSGYNFIYTLTDLRGAHPVDLEVRGIPLEKVLSLVFIDQPFTFSVEKNFVI